MSNDKNWLLREVRKLPYETEHGFTKVKLIDMFPLIHQLDEPEKIVIPQFVADHIEFCKSENKRLKVALSKSPESKMVFEMGVNWEEANEIYARAWLDGYEVEKEKLYYIKFSESQYAQKFDETKIDSMLINDKSIAGKFTKEEIEKMNPNLMALAVEVEVEAEVEE